jgi:hypothetical protein
MGRRREPVSRTEGIVTLFQIEWTPDGFAGSDIQQESVTTHHNLRITDKEARERGERTDRYQIQVSHPVGIAWILTRRGSKVTPCLYPETRQIAA